MPDRRRSLASAIAVSFSLSATLLFPTVAQAVSDDVAVQLLQRLDQLEGEVRDLRGENEQLRDRLGNLPQASKAEKAETVAKPSDVDADVTVTPSPSVAPSTAGNSNADSPTTPRLNLSLPEVDAPAVAVDATRESATTPAEKSEATTPELSTATSRADAAEQALQASADADVKDAEQTKQADAADKGDEADAGDETDRLIADIQKAAEKQVASRVSPDSSDSYFTYGEKGKKAIVESNARTIPMPQATATVASTANDTAADKKDDKAKTAPVAANNTANNTEKQARMAYNDAYKLVRQSPADAVTSFRNFLNNYPKHRLASNAQYWLGESLYAQQDYSGASVEFMKVLKQHKDSDKAPGAALKLGFSFYELKQWELARRTLEDTKRFFPNNSVAQLAQSRLTKMDAEGR